MIKTNIYYILILILVSSCTYSNQNVVQRKDQNVIMEDSLQKIINQLKIDAPDTFIFLNYWYGMPREFIDIMNTINSKEENIVVYGSDSSLYYVFENTSELSASIAFLTNDSTQTLEAVELTNVWWTSADEPKGAYGPNFFFSDKIETFYSIEYVNKEVTELYNYLQILFGSGIQTEFNNEQYSLLHANKNNPISNQFSEYSGLNNYSKTEYPPQKNLLWINDNRYINSVCTKTNVFQETKMGEHIIGTKIENRIIFTSIEFINLLNQIIEDNSQNSNLMKRKKLQLQQKQRETI